MSSLGLTKGGAGVVGVLQRAWTNAIEGDIQQHDDKLDVLRDVAIGTANGIQASAARLVWPVRIVCASLALGAVSVTGLFVVELLRLFQPVAEVLR